MRVCRPKDTERRVPQHAGERENPSPLASLFVCFFLLLGLPYVNWASQEHCLLYLRSSLWSSDLLLFFFHRLFSSLSFPPPFWTPVSYSNYLTLWCFKTIHYNLKCMQGLAWCRLSVWLLKRNQLSLLLTWGKAKKLRSWEVKFYSGTCWGLWPGDGLSIALGKLFWGGRGEGSLYMIFGRKYLPSSLHLGTRWLLVTEISG